MKILLFHLCRRHSLLDSHTQDHMLSNMHGHDNSVHAELGASFLSLISGSSAHVPFDQQRLLFPNTVPISNPLPSASSHRTPHVFSGGSRVSGVSWPHTMDCPHLTSADIFPPVTLLNANTNCSNNSQIHEAASLDVKKPQIVLCHKSHDKVKVKSLYPSIANNISNMKHPKYPHLTTSQKFSMESNASAPNSFLGVSSSSISGSLLLNDTGLLGVVCTCHGLYMSISKFSEHSGSFDVDPGNAICMNSGETVAEWWKAFTSRTGIRILEGQRRWDWPEGITVASGLRSHPISSMSNNSIRLNQIGSFRDSVSYEQKNCRVINSQQNHSHSNMVDENINHEPSQVCNNFISKYFTNNFHENLPHAVGQHLRGLPNSFCVHSGKASQSVAPALDIIWESANSNPAFPNIQDLKTSGNGFTDGSKSSLIVERLGVSSSIDLQLGQPPQRSQTLETKHKLANGSNINVIHEEPSEVFLHDKPLHTTGNVWKGSRSTLQYTDIYSNPPKRRGNTELEYSHRVEGTYGAKTDCWKDSLSFSLETTNVNSKLLSGFRNPETECQLRNNYENSSHSHVDGRINYEYKASERDRTYLPWSLLPDTINELGTDVSTARSNMNEEKGVERGFNGLLGEAKSNGEVSKELKGKANTLNLGLGNKSTVFQLQHCRRKNLSLPKEKLTVIRNGLQYKNMEMPAAWDRLELSDGDDCPPVRSVQESDTIKNSYVQSSMTIASLISKGPIQLLDSLEMRDNLTLPSGRMGHICEKFCTMTGISLYTEDSDIPPVEQLSLRPRGTECSFTHSKEDHSSQGLRYAYVPEKCSSTAQEKYLAEQNDLNGENCCNLVKGDQSGAATMVLFLKKSAKSLDKAESSLATNTNNAKSCSFQWRDVPKKVIENCSLITKEEEAVSYCPLEFPDADIAKSFAGCAQIAVSLKEREVSNISSRCSAPDVTQSSSGVYKKDASTTKVRNISFADSFLLDKGSGRSCSSDGLDSEYSPELCGSSSKINLIKSKPFKLVPRKQALSLIDEIRLQNSLQSKRSYTFHEDSDHLQMFDLVLKKKRKATKWRRLDVSGHFSTNERSPECSDEVGKNANSFLDMQMQLGCDQGSSSNCGYSVKQSDKRINSAFSAAVSLGKDFQKVHHQREKQKTEAHKTLVVDDTPKSSEMFQTKRKRLNDPSTRPTEVRGVLCSAEFTEKLTSLGGCCDFPCRSNFQEKMVRPNVWGKYGIISNRNPSKPTKIVPLSDVLKTAVCLAYKRDKKADNYKKLRSASAKVKKMSGRHVTEAASGKKILKSRVKKCGTRSLQLIELEPSENAELATASCCTTKGSDYPSCAKCNNHGITDRKTEDNLKTKFKEGWQHSLHELLFKGSSVNSSFVENSSSLCQTTSRCCGEVMRNAVDCRVQTSEMNKTMGCSEKHRPEKPDRLCSEKNEHNRLLQCNRFLLKELQDEAEALQNGEKFLVCARTEGYKGRKREGVLHNHSHDRKSNSGCLVPQEQLNAWAHIHQQKPQRRGHPKLSNYNVESDCRKAYSRYKQSKSWKSLVVYKSSIHALGLYTSQFIFRGAMVVEYVGEIVGPRVADRRESEYELGKKLQHKSACYFFRIDNEHIIDATRKGGIGRFVNHSCRVYSNLLNRFSKVLD